MSLGIWVTKGPGGEMSTQLSQVHTSLGWQTYRIVQAFLWVFENHL